LEILRIKNDVHGDLICGARLGAIVIGVKLGANGDGAVLPRQRQLGVVGQVTWGLGANVNGAKLCYLGASVDGAKPRVHFLKSFRQGRI
jgi:hypothetical protein